MRKTIPLYSFVNRVGPTHAKWVSKSIAWLLVVGWCVLLGGAMQIAYAQDGAATSSDGSSQATREVSDNEVKEVAQELWCPLCSGVRLDTCELKACQQMREEIALQLASGESPESIKAYFLDQYGPQVLGEPPREGFNLLAWIVPFVVLVGAGGLLLFRSRRMLAQRTALQPVGALAHGVDGYDDDYLDAVEDDNEDDNVLEEAPAKVERDAQSVPGTEPADSYERALDKELREYE